MKDGFREILGRQIAGVVVANGEQRAPGNQVFLLFTDGTHFEMYGKAFTCCAGIDRGHDVDRCIAPGCKVVQRYGGLDSWKMASEAIERARR